MTDAKPDRDGSAVSRAAMPGDPLDPSRARLGTWALYLGIAVSVSTLIGGAIFEVGPFAWSIACSSATASFLRGCRWWR